jgi:hypothetical protein
MLHITHYTLHILQGTILPPAKLQYANMVVEPGLKGTWNLMQLQFSHPAKSRDG